MSNCFLTCSVYSVRKPTYRSVFSSESHRSTLPVCSAIYSFKPHGVGFHYFSHLPQGGSWITLASAIQLWSVTTQGSRLRLMAVSFMCMADCLLFPMPFPWRSLAVQRGWPACVPGWSSDSGGYTLAGWSKVHHLCTVFQTGRPIL